MKRFSQSLALTALCTVVATAAYANSPYNDGQNAFFQPQLPINTSAYQHGYYVAATSYSVNPSSLEGIGLNGHVLMLEHVGNQATPYNLQVPKSALTIAPASSSEDPGAKGICKAGYTPILSVKAVGLGNGITDSGTQCELGGSTLQASFLPSDANGNINIRIIASLTPIDSFAPNAKDQSTSTDNRCLALAASQNLQMSVNFEIVCEENHA